MHYTPFPEANQALHPPVSADGTPTGEPIEVLVLTYPSTGQVGTVSCWQVSWWEAIRILFRRRIYVGVLGKSVPTIQIAPGLADLVGTTGIEKHPIRRDFGHRESLPHE